MPEQKLFNKEHGGFPVKFEVKKLETSDRYIYNVETFVPYILHPQYLEVISYNNYLLCFIRTNY